MTKRHGKSKESDSYTNLFLRSRSLSQRVGHILNNCILFCNFVKICLMAAGRSSNCWLNFTSCQILGRESTSAFLAVNDFFLQKTVNRWTDSILRSCRPTYINKHSTSVIVTDYICPDLPLN